MSTTTAIAFEQLELLLERAAERDPDVVDKAERQALLEHGVATCPSCETTFDRCSFCGAGAVHCDCEAPPSCVDDARRSEAADHAQALAKDGGL